MTLYLENIYFGYLCIGCTLKYLWSWSSSLEVESCDLIGIATKNLTQSLTPDLFKTNDMKYSIKDTNLWGFRSRADSMSHFLSFRKRSEKCCVSPRQFSRYFRFSPQILIWTNYTRQDIRISCCVEISLYSRETDVKIMQRYVVLLFYIMEISPVWIRLI